MLALARKHFVLLSLGLFCFVIRPDALDLNPPRGRMAALPGRTLWVWERPENLRSIDPKSTAIATLDGSLLLGNRMMAIPRRQFYAVSPGTRRIAVVRIEAPDSIAPDLAPAAAERILDLASAPDAAALQIDFDARRSQRPFYISLLREVRRRMPPDLPLSMTALASWCSNDDWIQGLPIDEAVPMFFRMEPGRRFAQADAPEFTLSGSVGISTHEPAPASFAGKRMYIFADRGWREDFPLLSSIASASRTQP